MDASRAAAPNGSGAAGGARILVLGADLDSIGPVIDRLERWGASPLVLFDVPSALNALTRSRPYLVIVDSRFGPDLAGLLAALQGDRVLPADARRPVPTLVLAGPNDPPLGAILGPELTRLVATFRRDQPGAVEHALRQALEVAGLSSYAPQAFGAPPLEALEPVAPVPAAPAPSAPQAMPAVVSRGAPVAPRPARRRRRGVPVARLTLAAALLLALLGIPTFLLTDWPGGRPEAQPPEATRATQPGVAGTAPTTPGTAPGSTPGAASGQGTPGAAGTPGAVAPGVGSTPQPQPGQHGQPGQPGQPGPGFQPGPPGSAGQTSPPGSAAQPGQPGPPGGSILDPLIGLLGPLVGAPAPGAPGTSAAPGAPPAAAPGAPAGAAPGTAPGAAQPGGARAPGAAPGAPAGPTVRAPWQPPQAMRVPFCGAVERWRQPVRDTLAEAWNEGRLDGPAGALDDDLVLALVLRESTGDPLAIGTGGEGEVGLLQLMPGTFAEQLGRPAGEPLPSLVQAMQDPRLNLRAGVRYLARAFAAQGGDLYWSLVAYRTGLEGAASWRRAGGTPPEIDARVRATLETYARHRPDVRLVFVPSPGAPAPVAVRPVLPAGVC